MIFNVEKVLSLLSTCVYPEFAKLPYIEEDIHKGMPHYTNMGYGFSKRMLDVQARTYRDQYESNFINIKIILHITIILSTLTNYSL